MEEELIAETASGSNDPDTLRVSAGAVSVIDRLAASGRLRCRVAFEQYALAVELLRERVCQRIAAGVTQDRWQTGVANELALALKLSPHQATALLSTATALHREMPHTLARLHAADIAPEAIPKIVSGISHLDAALRREADAQLCADPATLAGMGLKRVQDQVRTVAYHLDARATVDRIAAAEADRRVTIRPEPDCMARVSILLPMAKAVGIYAALHHRAAAIAGRDGDRRSRGQVMADTAFELLTGPDTGVTDTASVVPVTVNLTMSAEALLADRPGTAHLDNGGALPAEIARRIVGAAAAKNLAWIRRLYVQPDAGALVAADARARRFPATLAAVVAARDQYCRTPHCDAPIAHIDHVTRHSDGGDTSLDNGQGLCAACNHAKEGAGWTSTVAPDPSGRHTVHTTTPDGSTYRSTAPHLAA